MTTEVRCALCKRKLMERLEGVAWIWCRHCKKLMRIDSRVLATVD